MGLSEGDSGVQAIKVAFTTIGCKLNQFETMAMREALEDAGYTTVPFGIGADIYVINTCTVTGRSDYKGRQMVRRAVRMRPPGGIVVVTGCQSQLRSEEMLELGADMILGNSEKVRLVDLINEGLNGGTRPLIRVRKMSEAKEFQLMHLRSFPGYSRAFLKIQDGCNNRCTYCTVWMARGPARSAPPSWVVSEAQTLVLSGYREVVLTGVHMGAYKYNEWDLTRLLEAILELNGLERIRLSSIEPLEFTQPLKKLILTEEMIAPHLHIPIQSGDDEVLKRMGRNYSREYVRELVWGLHRERPELGIGVDAMVGFPGETPQAFENTRSLLEELPISYMHIFTYSPRPSTRAAKEKKQVSPEEKGRRYAILRELRTRKMRAFRERFLGKDIRVLVEGRREKESGLLRGLSENYIPFLFMDNPDVARGSYVTARAIRIEGETLMGRVVG